MPPEVAERIEAAHEAAAARNNALNKLAFEMQFEESADLKAIPENRIVEVKGKAETGSSVRR